MGKQLAAQQQPVPTGCAVSIKSEVSSQAVKHKDVESGNTREDFEPFVLEGTVSLDGDKVHPNLSRSCVTLVVHSQRFWNGRCLLMKLVQQVKMS